MCTLLKNGKIKHPPNVKRVRIAQSRTCRASSGLRPSSCAMRSLLRCCLLSQENMGAKDIQRTSKPDRVRFRRCRVSRKIQSTCANPRPHPLPRAHKPQSPASPFAHPHQRPHPQPLPQSQPPTPSDTDAVAHGVTGADNSTRGCMTVAHRALPPVASQTNKLINHG